MTGERDIDYEGLVQDAMRGVVRAVLTRVAKSGLPGEHHFYIAFKTDSPGVGLSDRLRQKYPEEMTVVLQHRFWELAVHNSFFEVKLTFDGVPERLVVPFDAIKVFFDPSVPYGLQFDDLDAAGGEQVEGAVANQRAARRAEEPARAPDTEAPQARGEKKPRATRRPPAEKSPAPGTAKSAPAKPALPTLVKPGGEPTPPKGPKVVSIDAFRKK
jgi:hypothetical protein